MRVETSEYKAGKNRGRRGKMTTDETEQNSEYMRGWNDGFQDWYSKWFPFLAESK